MVTIKYSITLVLALALCGARSTWAQDTDTGDPAKQADNPGAAEFVPGSQTVPVADQDIDDGDDVGPPVASDEDLLLREFELFKQLMQDKVLDEADTVAKRVVELAIQLKGPQSSEFAKALTNLAIVQFQSKEYDASKQNFASAIEIIEDNEDRLNGQLINPLRGLGAAQLESGRPDQASDTFRRAVHISHVNEGPHNLDQVELLESIAETFLRMGDLDTAKEAQDTIYALNIRQHDLDTMELIPSLMRRATWQHRAGFIYDERSTYRRVVRIIEEKIGRDALELVEPLIMLGKSYFFIDTSGTESYTVTRMTSGEIYFRRAAKIAAENPATNWQIVAQAALALGDYYMYENNPQRARQAYNNAWELLSEDESRLDVRRDQLENTVTLKQQDIPQYVAAREAADDEQERQDDDSLLQGSVKLAFTISTRGRASDIVLLEAKPAEFKKMLNYVIREVRRRIYRPRYEDGVAVETPDQLLDHTFFYRQSDLDALQTESAATDGA